MDPSALIAGLIISACYDLIKRSLNKVIAPTFSKVYDETIDELSQKYENIDRLCFDAFFRDEKVKEEVNKFKERKEIDFKILTDEFKRFLMKKKIM